jgi:hypothetical protein
LTCAIGGVTVGVTVGLARERSDAAQRAAAGAGGRVARAAGARAGRRRRAQGAARPRHAPRTPRRLRTGITIHYTLFGHLQGCIVTHFVLFLMLSLNTNTS